MNTGIVGAIVLGRLLGDIATGEREEAAIDLYQALRRPPLPAEAAPLPCGAVTA
jgi:2-polyprenyl-6-methoxyphenol hydroxylase-like FAD-dependent oxidoreductase